MIEYNSTVCGIIESELDDFLDRMGDKHGIRHVEWFLLKEYPEGVRQYVVTF